MYGGDAGTARSQMTDDHVEIFEGLVEIFGNFKCCILIGQAVKAVFSESVFFCSVGGDGIGIGAFWQRSMERCVKGNVLWFLREDILANFNDA